ncbi:MAG TPA: hypothetical protein VM348_03935, partial [Brevundimonas sp.]|nr:hypothetical protein [Brevundimonas sp.]
SGGNQGGSEGNQQGASQPGQGGGEQGGGAQGNDGTTAAEAITLVQGGKTYVLQDHVNTLVGNARTDGKKSAEAEATRLANEAAAKAKGDFEKLATDRQARIEELEQDIAERDKKELRRAVGAKHKLPTDIADLLIGDDQAALEEHAKRLAKTVGVREAPDTEGGAGENGSSGPSDRPLPKKPPAGEKQPVYTFDGKPKVAWPGRA